MILKCSNTYSQQNIQLISITVKHVTTTTIQEPEKPSKLRNGYITFP